MDKKTIAKRLIANADSIIKVINAFIAKEDDKLKKQLKKEGFVESDKTVESIADMESEVLDVLQAQTSLFLDAIEESSDLKEAKKRLQEVMEEDTIAEDIADICIDMLDSCVLSYSDSYMAKLEPDLHVTELRDRTTDWFDSWSEQLGEYIRSTTHKQLTNMLAKAVKDGDDIASMARKIKEGRWRDEYYQARRIAVTEVLRAHSVAMNESIMQSPSADRKEWRHTGAHKNKPRLNHVAMDHQTVPKEDPFVLKGKDGAIYYPMYPRDPILPAGESINCHCIHRGVVNDDIFGLPLKERQKLHQKYIDADNEAWMKAKDNSNRAKAGIEVTDEGESAKTKYEYEASVIDRKYIASAEYQNKFNSIGENKKVTRSVRAKAKEMLRHRSGSNYEDLAYIDTKTGKSIINKEYNRASTAKPSRAMTKMLKSADAYTIIGIHNHPNSSTPSIDDIIVAVKRKYKYGIVVGHNGTLFKYTITGTVNEVNADIYLAKINTMFYNGDVEGMANAIETLSQNGVKLEVF